MPEQKRGQDRLNEALDLNQLDLHIPVDHRALAQRIERQRVRIDDIASRARHLRDQHAPLAGLIRGQYPRRTRILQRLRILDHHVRLPQPQGLGLRHDTLLDIAGSRLHRHLEHHDTGVHEADRQGFRHPPVPPLADDRLHDQLLIRGERVAAPDVAQLSIGVHDDLGAGQRDADIGAGHGLGHPADRGDVGGGLGGQKLGEGEDVVELAAAGGEFQDQERLLLFLQGAGLQVEGGTSHTGGHGIGDRPVERDKGRDVPRFRRDRRSGGDCGSHGRLGVLSPGDSGQQTPHDRPQRSRSSDSLPNTVGFNPSPGSELWHKIPHVRYPRSETGS